MTLGRQVDLFGSFFCILLSNTLLFFHLWKTVKWWSCWAPDPRIEQFPIGHLLAKRCSHESLSWWSHRNRCCSWAMFFSCTGRDHWEATTTQEVKVSGAAWGCILWCWVAKMIHYDIPVGWSFETDGRKSRVKRLGLRKKWHAKPIIIVKVI